LKGIEKFILEIKKIQQGDKIADEKDAWRDDEQIFAIDI